MEHFQRGTVEQMIAEHVSGRQNHNRALLSLIVFELWHDQYIRPSDARMRETVLTRAVEWSGDPS